MILPVASAIRYLHGWIDAVRHIPAETIEIFASLISAGQWALPVALYASVLLTLAYSVRRSFSGPLSILCVFLLSVGFTTGIFLGLFYADSSLALPGQAAPPALGTPGLILTQGDTAVILLDDPLNPSGSRVIAVPNRPLMYQKVPAGPVRSGFTLPLIPFKIGDPYFMTSLFIDFSLAAGQFRDRLSEGLIPFGMYLGALCFLLSSLRCVLELTSWPLANVFLGILAFRGVLVAGTFLDSGEVRQFIKVFLKVDIPQTIITPLVFCGAALLVILYTVLVNLTRGRRTAP
ncbi:MAG: hypothetical protein LBF74_11230 [Treponema sp.]|nr:hypothetical protein [Treponema sp.]